MEWEIEIRQSTYRNAARNRRCYLPDSVRSLKQRNGLIFAKLRLEFCAEQLFTQRRGGIVIRKKRELQ